MASAYHRMQEARHAVGLPMADRVQGYIQAAEEHRSDMRARRGEVLGLSALGGALSLPVSNGLQQRADAKGRAELYDALVRVGPGDEALGLASGTVPERGLLRPLLLSTLRKHDLDILERAGLLRPGLREALLAEGTLAEGFQVLAPGAPPAVSKALAAKLRPDAGQLLAQHLPTVRSGPLGLDALWAYIDHSHRGTGTKAVNQALRRVVARGAVAKTLPLMAGVGLGAAAALSKYRKKNLTPAAVESDLRRSDALRMGWTDLSMAGDVVTPMVGFVPDALGRLRDAATLARSG